jgi:tRNA dimethylallyltransferase
MQMYKGLPVITNQISAEEQKGIPHHLLATVELDKPTWTVGVFAQEATKLIREIRSRGKLPIVVGGTHYYISSLLFENNFVVPTESTGEPSSYIQQTDIEKQHPILDGPTDLMLRRLREVDPVMASRWHPDDRRKIKRSLEIFLTTGKRASDIYAEQQRSKNDSVGPERPWEALMFWVYSKPDILKDRLSNRIDKMERVGLMGEVRALHEHLLKRISNGEEVDRTRGIWQSIGFKQFEPFLMAEKEALAPKELEKRRAASSEAMKIATRQYAKYQLKWLRTKTIPELMEKNATKFLYLMDSSDADRFTDNVLSPAADITRAYLEGLETPDPDSISETARDVLSSFRELGAVAKPVFEARLCDTCMMTLRTEEEWTKHIKGARHRRGVKHKGRTALIPVERPSPLQVETTETTVDGLTGFPQSP